MELYNNGAGKQGHPRFDLAVNLTVSLAVNLTVDLVVSSIQSHSVTLQSGHE